MIPQAANLQRLRLLLALLLSLMWATMSSATALAERGDFGHSSLAANSGLRAESSLQGQLLRQDLLRQEAASAFTATGELSPGALAGAREIIPAADLGNLNIPADFSKWSTRTFQSPSGDFQAHFYKNSTTGEIFNGLDYKINFNSTPAPLWPGPK